MPDGTRAPGVRVGRLIIGRMFSNVSGLQVLKLELTQLAGAEKAPGQGRRAKTEKPVARPCAGGICVAPG